jgi:hypothetical protein
MIIALKVTLAFLFLFISMFLFGCDTTKSPLLIKTEQKWETNVSYIEYHRSMAPNDDRIIHTKDGRSFWCTAYDTKTIKNGDSVGIVTNTYRLRDGTIISETTIIFQNCPKCVYCE